MKNLWAFAVVLLLLTTLTACGSSSDSIVGNWSYGDADIYSFHEDGTVIYYADYNTVTMVEGQYAWENGAGEATFEGEHLFESDMELEMDGNRLKITHDGGYYTLDRGGEIPKIEESSSKSSNNEESEVSIVGMWNNDYVEMSLVFREDGTYTLSDAAGAMDGIYDVGDIDGEIYIYLSGSPDDSGLLDDSGQMFFWDENREPMEGFFMQGEEPIYIP